MNDELRKMREELQDLQRKQKWIAERLAGVERRLASYEANEGYLEQDQSRVAEAAAPVQQQGQPAAAPPQMGAAGATAAPSARNSNDLEKTIGGIWLNRAGVIIFILGAAFFLGYAFDQGWINELTRIIIGAATSFVLLAFGERNRRRGYNAYAQGVTGGGIALLYFTIFAAFYYYDILTPTVGLALMILVTIGAAALSVYQDSPAIAALGLLTGFLNPILFVAQEPHFLYLFIYLVLINIGVLAVTHLKRWVFMGVTAFVVTNLYMAFLLIYRVNQWAEAPGAMTYQIFLSVFLLLYLALPLLLYTARRKPMEALGVLLSAAGFACYYFFSWGNLELDYPDVRGFFTLGLAAFALLMGLSLRKLPFKDSWAAFTPFAVTAVLLAFFVPIELQQPYITIAWVLQAAVLCYLGLRLKDSRIHVGFWALLAAVLVHLMAFEWFETVEAAKFVFLGNRPFLLTIFFVLSLAACAYLFHKMGPLHKKHPGSEIRLLGVAAGLIFLIYGSAEIMRYGEALAELSGDYGHYHNLRMLFLSSFWVVYAVALAAAGFIAKLPPLRYGAMALFGLTVLKVFLLDLSYLELVYRIISLVGLGLILLGVSYIYQKKKV